jgi:hypothetical protein
MLELVVIALSMQIAFEGLAAEDAMWFADERNATQR